MPVPARPQMTLFYLQSSSPPRHLHSFPTRRSSDLSGATPCGWDDFTATGKWVGEAEYAEDGYVCNPGQVCKGPRSEEHTSELQSRFDLVCRLLLEKKK